MHKNHRNPKDKPHRDQHHGYKWWLEGCKHRQWAARQQIIKRRRRDRRLIHHERWEEIPWFEDPEDHRMWS